MPCTELVLKEELFCSPNYPTQQLLAPTHLRFLAFHFLMKCHYLRSILGKTEASRRTNLKQDELLLKEISVRVTDQPFSQSLTKS